MVAKVLAFLQNISTFYWCFRSGLSFNSTWRIDGKIHIIRNRMLNWYKHRPCGEVIIGNNFCCHNKFSANSIGLIQPTMFNVSVSGSKLIIGDNVGISGSTITVSSSITIGNNVRIGSGCLILDNDAHQLKMEDRLNNTGMINIAPIVIEDNVFIGARSIILKGVHIGKGAVVGAGSVVSSNIPDNAIVAGNPAKIIKFIEQ